MQREIDAIKREVRFGFLDREKAQRKICDICLADNNYECRSPCERKRILQNRLYRAKGLRLCIDPQRLEIIEKAQLEQIPIATLEVPLEGKKSVRKDGKGIWRRKRKVIKFRDGSKRELYEGGRSNSDWISFRIGSERWPDMELA